MSTPIIVPSSVRGNLLAAIEAAGYRPGEEIALDSATIEAVVREEPSVALAILRGLAGRLRDLAFLNPGVRIVLADGSVHDCDAGTEPDLFEAARVSLGALGIITEVTLQCVPAFLLRAQEDPGTLSGTLASLDELVGGNDHFEFYWFPHTDRVLLKRLRRLPSGHQQRLAHLQSL